MLGRISNHTHDPGQTDGSYELKFCLHDPISYISERINGIFEFWFKNRLDVSANLAIWNMHAKYQLIQAIHLARAMGVVQKTPPHLIIGGCLYTFQTSWNFVCLIQSAKLADASKWFLNFFLEAGIWIKN